MSLNGLGKGSMRPTSSGIPLRNLSPGGHTWSPRNRLSPRPRSPQPDAERGEYQDELAGPQSSTSDVAATPTMAHQNGSSFFQKGKKKSRLSDADSGGPLQSGEEEERLLAEHDRHGGIQDSESAFDIRKEVGTAELVDSGT